MSENPFERIRAYTTPGQDGCTIHPLTCLEDAVMLAKMAFLPKEEFLQKAGEIFDEMQVEVKPPVTN